MTFLFCSKDLNMLNLLLNIWIANIKTSIFLLKPWKHLLKTNVFHENGKFVTNVYRKETFTEVYTNFPSFIPLEHKFGLVYTVLHHCFCLISDMSKFHFQIEKLKESSNINEVIRSVLIIFFFFYNKISQVQKNIKTQFEFFINVALKPI